MFVNIYWEEGYNKGIQLTLPPDATEGFTTRFVNALRKEGFEVKVWATQTVEIMKPQNGPKVPQHRD